MTDENVAVIDEEVVKLAFDHSAAMLDIGGRVRVSSEDDPVHKANVERIRGREPVLEPMAELEWHRGDEEPEMESVTIRLWKDGTVDYGVFRYPFWECIPKCFRDKPKYRAGKPLWWVYPREIATSAVVESPERDGQTPYLVFVSVDWNHKTFRDHIEIGCAVENSDVGIGHVWHERQRGNLIEHKVKRCVALPEGYVDAIQ